MVTGGRRAARTAGRAAPAPAQIHRGPVREQASAIIRKCRKSYWDSFSSSAHSTGMPAFCCYAPLLRGGLRSSFVAARSQFRFLPHLGARAMGLHLRSIRQKILLLVLVPVLSLIGVYIFATSLTARAAINLARTDTLRNATGVPTGNFLATIDQERPLALVYLSRPTGANLAALEYAESKTSASAAMMRTALDSERHDGQRVRRGEARDRRPAHGHHRDAGAARPDPLPDHHPVAGVHRLQQHRPGRLRGAEPGDPAGDQRQGGHPVAGLRPDGQVRGDAAARGRAGARGLRRRVVPGRRPPAVHRAGRRPPGPLRADPG